MTGLPENRPLVVFMVAGESSGDALGAALIRGLKDRHPGTIQFLGVGGPQMMAEGLGSLFPMEDLAVMGVAEVLPRLPKLLKRIRETVTAALNAKPDAVITIDSPDFSFRVAKKLKAKGIGPLIHYVAPTVWAWRPGRAAKIAGFLDHVLCLFPFEPAYFEAENLSATFVGHPVFASGIDKGNGQDFRHRHGMPDDAPLLAILPGSRSGEVTRHLPIFLNVFKGLREIHSNLRGVLPTVPHLYDRVAEMVTDAHLPILVVSGEEEKRDAFAASTLALAASGTVSLELAVAGVPTVVAYRMNGFTAMLAKRLIKVRYASLVNIVEDAETIPEFIQENCTKDNLQAALVKLMDDQATSAAQRQGFNHALSALGRDGLAGGLRAADAVLSVIAEKKSREPLALTGE